MLFVKPLDQEIEAPLTAFRADTPAPARPVGNLFWEPYQTDDFLVGSVFQQPPRCPILVEMPAYPAAVQDFPELCLIQIVIPHEGQAVFWSHATSILPAESGRKRKSAPTDGGLGWE